MTGFWRFTFQAALDNFAFWWPSMAERCINDEKWCQFTTQSGLSVKIKLSSLLQLHFVIKDDQQPSIFFFLHKNILSSAALKMSKLSSQFAGLPNLQFQCYYVFLPESQ